MFCGFSEIVTEIYVVRANSWTKHMFWYIWWHSLLFDRNTQHNSEINIKNNRLDACTMLTRYI